MTDDTDQRPAHLWRKAGLVWLALSLGLAAMVASAYLDIGPWNLPVALIIATLQAATVIFVFMNLLNAEAGARIAAMASILWLALLIGITFADVATRSHMPAGFETTDR